MQDAKLEIIDLGCKREQHSLFSHLTVTLTESSLCLITGVNGAGKSSLLRMIAGLMTPTTGHIKWQSHRIDTHFYEYKQCLHYIGHHQGIKLGLTARENLALTQQLLIQKPTQSIDSLLMQLQLQQHANTQAYYLSAGQKRRLALAKLFIFPRKIWILDEPLTALDAATQHFFYSVLTTHIENHGIVILTTHQPLAFSATQTIELVAC